MKSLCSVSILCRSLGPCLKILTTLSCGCHFHSMKETSSCCWFPECINHAYLNLLDFMKTGWVQSLKFLLYIISFALSEEKILNFDWYTNSEDESIGYESKYFIKLTSLTLLGSVRTYHSVFLTYMGPITVTERKIFRSIWYTYDTEISWSNYQTTFVLLSEDVGLNKNHLDTSRIPSDVGKAKVLNYLTNIFKKRECP